MLFRSASQAVCRGEMMPSLHPFSCFYSIKKKGIESEIYNISSYIFERYLILSPFCFPTSFAPLHHPLIETARNVLRAHRTTSPSASKETRLSNFPFPSNHQNNKVPINNPDPTSPTSSNINFRRHQQTIDNANVAINNRSRPLNYTPFFQPQ